MDEKYKRKVSKVMRYLADNGRSRVTVRIHSECYLRLGRYLSEKNLPYSVDRSWEWFDGISGDLYTTSYDIYVGALCKIADLYETGEIKKIHCRKQRKEDLLSKENKRVLNGYCAHMQISALAKSTIINRRAAATRFMFDLQERGVTSVLDVQYRDLIAILLECESMTYYAKTGYREKIRSLLAYLSSESLVRYGFSLLVGAMTLKKGYCWNNVDAEVVTGLRSNQQIDTEAFSLDDYRIVVNKLAKEHRKLGYSHGSVCSITHFGSLLYLFMDINGLRFDIPVANSWLESMRLVLSRDEFVVCRRVVMLLEQSFEGMSHNLSRSFRFKETLHDKLPLWCVLQVDAFLKMKASEGWKQSTLVMFRTCICRFCISINDIGVTNFADLSAQDIKLFNVRDIHSTPEGKNAFNSRIRQFLYWLGCKGMLTNPNLFLALPNVAAPKETHVVTLTHSEQKELGVALSEKSDITLRDKAMLQMGLRMGIRASDVAGLHIKDINWKNPSVRFVQAKTGYEVNLPMPTEVANAIFRYITLGRQISCEESVFLRSKAPFTPISANVAQESLRRALPNHHVPGSGFHVLRKTFASNMLKEGATPAQVAEALGHSGLDNVRKYLALDEKRMRLCAISLEEAGISFKGGFPDEV